jgi:hypothetical protein
MNNAGGFITLHRKILEWEWYKNGNTKDLFFHLLLTANFADTRFQGKTIKRGQIVTSLPSLSTETGMTIQQVRTSLNHLVLTGEITDESCHQYRVITIVKYDDYQKLTDKSTDDQQTINRRTNRQSTDDLTGDQQHHNNINNNNKGTNRTREPLETPPSPSSDLFDSFWSEYPRKTDKQAAVKAWKKLSPDPDMAWSIMEGLRKWKASDQWVKDDGTYIPYPATWLNKRRWEDEDIRPYREQAPSRPAAKPSAPAKRVIAQEYDQRDYDSVQQSIDERIRNRVLSRLRQEGGDD